MLSDRQQFQRDQLKAAEVRSLQSPTLQPQTPIQLPTPILRAPPMRSPTAVKSVPTFVVPEALKKDGQLKQEQSRWLWCVEGKEQSRWLWCVEGKEQSRWLWCVEGILGCNGYDVKGLFKWEGCGNQLERQ